MNTSQINEIYTQFIQTLLAGEYKEIATLFPKFPPVDPSFDAEDNKRIKAYLVIGTLEIKVFSDRKDWYGIVTESDTITKIVRIFGGSTWVWIREKGHLIANFSIDPTIESDQFTRLLYVTNTGNVMYCSPETAFAKIDEKETKVDLKLEEDEKLVSTQPDEKTFGNFDIQSSFAVLIKPTENDARMPLYNFCQELSNSFFCTITDLEDFCKTNAISRNN